MESTRPVTGTSRIAAYCPSGGCPGRFRRGSRTVVLLLALLCAGCGPSLEESVEKLGGSPEERARARQELLLAKGRSVEPLLDALGDPRFETARPELVDVLVSLMMRVGDARIEKALLQRLDDDPDPRVRARIARQLGLFKRQGAIDALIQATGDTDGEVRFQALQALGGLEDKLDEAQQETLRERSRRLLSDAHPGTRMEATIRVEGFVDTNLDHYTYLHAGINSRATVVDVWHRGGLPAGNDLQWNALSETAAHVGDDFWSLEYRLSFDGDRILRARPGALWGFNFVRTFRGSEFSQWVRTYENGAHSPDDFGLLRFE